MREHWTFFKHEIARNPAILLVLAACCMCWWMNATAGYAILGKSPVMGFVFVLLGMFGAYCAVAFESERGPRKWIFLVAAIVGFGIDQLSGWQNFGVRFSDGMTARSTQAEGLAGDIKLKKSLQAELDGINARGVRPLEQINADMALECDRKSKLYPDGVGPKCTALRGELGSVKRKQELEQRISALQKQLEGREQVGDPTANLGVMLWVSRRLASLTGGKGLNEKQVLLGLELVLTAFLGFIATFGFALCGVRFHRQPEADPKLLGFTRRDDWFPGAPSGPRGGPSGGGGGGGGYRPPTEFAPVSQTVGQQPIHINVGMAPSPQVAEARAVDQALGFVPRGAAAQWAAEAPARRDLEALPADGRPVDRSRVSRPLSDDEREAADVILAFRRAVVEDAPGAVVSMLDLYRRYCRWCGERAVSAETFGTLWPDLTGASVAEIGGALHVRDIALRAAFEPVIAGGSRAA